VGPRVWVAGEHGLDAVTGLMAAFRDWWGYDEPADDALRRSVAALLRDPGADFLLGAPGAGGAPAGVCQLRYRPSVWTGADDCWLEDLWVGEDARRSGLGRAIVAAAFERARARGCRRIELDVNERNAGALAFYESLGFTTEPKPPGRTLFLARRLDP
jgi:ribosomal protein S18 acetylase RimI-like enzyme